MQIYELTVIFPTEKVKDASEKLEKTVKDAQGKVAEKQDWGIRDLAYPIKKKLEASYLFYQLELPAERVNPFARLVQNDEDVLRYLLVKSNIKNQKSKTGSGETEEAKTGEPKKVLKKKVVKARKKK